MKRGAERIFDEYLVASAKAGDRKAFGMLVKRWNGKLVAHAWRLLGDGESARDAVQSAWVEALRGVHRLQDERAFPAWLYRIVTRRCARLTGHAVRTRMLGEALSAEPEPEQTDPDTSRDSRRMRAAMAALPPEQRAAVALFHLEEMSVAEVAVALEVPVGTVKTRLMHARRKLRAALEGED